MALRFATRRDARWRATRRRDARVFIDDGRSPRLYTARKTPIARRAMVEKAGARNDASASARSIE
jgi:hypothetical protein